MAIVLIDGFETAPVWKQSNSGGSVNAGAGRDGIGKSINITNNLTSFNETFPANITTMIAGFGWLYTASAWGAAGAGGGIQLLGDVNATIHLAINFDGTGHVLLRRGGTGSAIIATGTSVPAVNAWHYVEVKATCDDTVGICIIKFDGVTVINYTGDTRNAGTTPGFTGIQFGSMGNSNACRVDDLVVMDGTGSAPYNDFIGERVIRSGRPNGVGGLTALTPSSAVANWTTVDEDPWSATVDYVGGTSGTDTYATSDVTGLTLVDAVQISAYALKTDSGPRNLRTVARSSGGTVVESADLQLSTTIVNYTSPILMTDPTGAAWTQTNVNSAEFGAKVT